MTTCYHADEIIHLADSLRNFMVKPLNSQTPNTQLALTLLLKQMKLTNQPVTQIKTKLKRVNQNV